MILAIVLALPGFLYYVLVTYGKNRYTLLPVLGPKQVAKTTHRKGSKKVPDTLYHTLPDFKLTDENGKPVSLKTFDGKIFVAGFFYTHCPSVCTAMNNNINQIAGYYAKNKMVYFVSITVDPHRDSASVLQNYAAGFKPRSPKWLFLTGDTSTIYNLAHKGFMVDATQSGSDDFIYSDKLILIDQDKRIRGYYNGASATEASTLEDDIKVLILEELNKKDKALY
jgi:protein SCO1/2